MIGTTLNSYSDVFSNVSEASGYKLIYQVDIPVNANYGGATPVSYAVNNSGDSFPNGFDRVAYYLELVDLLGTTTNWVYVSMDDFTFGIPVAVPPARKPVSRPVVTPPRKDRSGK